MNQEHRENFNDPTRGQYAMEGIDWMLASAEIGGTPIALGDDLLEIGTAFGVTTVLLRDRVARLTGVELDPEMAAVAAERVAGTGARILNVDATKLPFDDGIFDSAVCIYVFHHVPTPQLQDRLLREAIRVLRPGGVFFGWDSLDSEDLRAYHAGDTFVPVAAETFADRLRQAGAEGVWTRRSEEWNTVNFAASAPARQDGRTV